MNIVTLTLNPATDVHCTGAHFAAGKENFAEITLRQSGGKGVNISRALTENGVENTAFLLLGEENGGEFQKGLDGALCRVAALSVPGRIRENITVHTPEGETRLSFPGFSVQPDILPRIEKELEQADVLTLTGSLPAGMTAEDWKPILRRATERGVKTVIDSRSFSLADLREIKPWLIKPNRQEISGYLGREVETFEEVIPEAKRLHEDGIENVMVSLGESGALLVCGEGVFLAQPPQVAVCSTIGAGDSSIAGFLTGSTAADRLCRAVAFGTAACLTEGTLPPRRDDVAEILKKVTVSRLSL